MPQDPEKKEVNLNDILLPKKEEHSPASATRINAGVLLENEQSAELPKGDAAPIVPPQRPEGPTDTPIAPLQTYESDVQSVISKKNISALDIASAESDRAGKSAFTLSTPKVDWGKVKSVATLLGSLLFVGAAAALLYFVFLRGAPTPVELTPAQTPFIAVDNTQVLLFTEAQLKRNTIMSNLVNLKDKTNISLGLISRVYLAVGSSSTAAGALPPPLQIQTLLSILAPNISQDFLRTLDPRYYIFGFHMFDGSQPFLILKVDSYEQAFSGMLAWERTMSQELSPLFTRIPRPKLNDEVQTPTGSTTEEVIVSPTQFKDKIVENHDARVIENAVGDILLIWTFLDRSTLLITTNEATLRELISRKSTFVSQSQK